MAPCSLAVIESQEGAAVTRSAEKAMRQELVSNPCRDHAVESHNSYASGDLSIELGRDPLRKPRFSRFVHPPANITAAVQEMRLAAAAKRASKQRSWAATYPFTKRSSNAPKFERFANPPTNIRAAVQRMRVVTRARMAFRTRSWEASYSFTRMSFKTPKFERFANPPTNITAAVLRMRAVTRARMAFRTRSWEASYSFTRMSFKTPKFERFANPPSDIQAAVQEMRLAAAAKRASKQRSWAATYTFTKRSLHVPKFKRFANLSCDIQVVVEEMRKCLRAKRVAKTSLEDEVLIEDMNDEPDVSAVVTVQAVRDSTMKMLMAPPSNMNKTREHLQYLLGSLQREVSNIDGNTLKMLERQLALPEPSGAPVSAIPAEPLSVTTFDNEPSNDSSWMRLCETELEPPTDKDVRKACVHCERSLRNFRMEMERQRATVEEEKHATEVEQLIQEEQAQKDKSDLEVEQLIQEEIDNTLDPTHNSKGTVSSSQDVTKPFKSPSTSNFKLGTIVGRPKQLDPKPLLNPAPNSKEWVAPSTMTSWVVGSPAAAARQLRRNSSVGGEIGACSAMALDLGCYGASCTPPEPHKQVKHSRTASLGALKVSKSKQFVGGLQPLLVPKSSKLFAFSSAAKGLMNTGESPNCRMDQCSFSCGSQHGNDRLAWNTCAM